MIPVATMALINCTHSQALSKQKLVSKNLVDGVSKLKFEKNRIREACQKGKYVKSSFKLKIFVLTTRPLELLHMDLFGPFRTMSLCGNYYGLVIIDDYSRYTWTLFILTKNDAIIAFKKLAMVLHV